MGVLRGSFSFVQFNVKGELPSSWLAQFEPAISMRRFVPLRPMGDDTETAGFVSPSSPFNDDEVLRPAHYVFSDKIFLAYREDTLKIPQALLKDKVAAKIKEQEQKSGQMIGSKTKSLIHAAVIAELRAKILPKSSVVEFIYDVPGQTVRLFSRGKGVHERFVAFFEQTFELKLVHLGFEEQAVQASLPYALQHNLSMLNHKDIFVRKERMEIN